MRRLSDAVVKLGLMPPLTGVVGIYGEEIARAGQIACREVNECGGVLGRPLELAIEDDGSLPESAVAAANRLVEHHHCAALVGNLLSNARIAVAYRVAEPRRIPYLNFSFYEGSILSRYFFHFAALPNQQIDRMIPAMRAKYGPRMFFAGNDYEWPRGSIDAARRALAGAGGTAVGEEYLPLGAAPDAVEALLDRVAAAAPDVFVPYFAGAGQLLLLERFAARGLKQRMAVVMGHYDEVMASRLPPEVREGLYSSNTYFMSVDTAENRQLLARLAAWEGVDGLWPHGNGMLTNFGEGAYLCVKAFALAANRAGSLDPEALVEALAGVALAGPQGAVSMDAATHHARVNAYLARCQADGSFALVETFGAIEPVLPERYRHLRVAVGARSDEDIRLQARMLEHMSDAVLLIRTDAVAIVYANAGAERMFGYGSGELIGRPLATLDAGADSAKRLELLARKGQWQGELRHVRKDGSMLWTFASVSAFTHPVHGEVWMAVHKDITQTENMRQFIKQAPVGIAMFDRDMNYLAASDRWRADYGRGHADLVGRNHYDVYPDLPDEWKRVHRRGLAGETIRNDADYWLQADGSRHWLRWSVQPWTYPGGEIGGIMISAEDITAQMLAQESLVRAKEAAELADRAKSAFLANMSHEIRTPLHIVIGLGHLLRRDLADPAQRQRMDQLCATSDHLLAIVNDILDLSKIEAERLTLDRRDFRLAEVVDKALRMLAEPAREKGLTLTADVAPAVRELRLQGDPLRLAQVLINLCGNAVKFTERGTVRLAIERLAAEAAGVALRFSVEDTGIGIAPADQERLFQPFVQADASSTRAHGGTGLGLAISQRLVALMGGTIRLDASTERGCRFAFELVLPPAAAAAAAAGEAAADAAATGDGGGRRVLLAEDHPLSQDILFEMLEDLGCEVDIASDGAEAVACARDRGYDLILMDMQMPELDGLAATRAIRALPGHRDTPIVALTANAFAEDRQRCLDAGMNAHIAKPVTPATLAAALGRWLADLDVPGAGVPVVDSELGLALTGIAGVEVPAAMRRSPGDLAEYGALLRRFVDMHGQDMAQLRRHLAAGERDAAHILAHNLKGIAGLVGARRIAALADDIVQGLRAGAESGVLEPRMAACAAEMSALAAAVAALPGASMA